MDIKRLKELLTEKQIIEIMKSLGADAIVSGNNNELLFRTICHCGDSHKLYYYRDSKSFHCYSNCGQMDIFNIIMNVLNINIHGAIKYVNNMFQIETYEMQEGFSDGDIVNKDWEILKSHQRVGSKEHERNFNILDEKLLNKFYRYYHPAFYKDGISFKTLYKFGIRYDILNQRIIIPHYDEHGNLIAIRCRNLNKDLIAEGKKYTPVVIDGRLLSAKTSLYLYGLNFNRENIKKTKRVILLESEKAVMQLDTILGQENNIGVALSSSALSVVQVAILKDLGVEEVIVALDKEYEEYGTNEEKLYAMKIRKGIINKLTPHFSVSVMWDKEGLLNKKDSPTDRGIDIFKALYQNRIKI